MTTAVVASDAPALASAALAAVSQLAGADLSALGEDQLLDLIRTMETVRRTVEAFDNLAVPELEARGVPARHLVRSTGQFLAGLLNLTPTETGQRVRHARELGERVQLTGERSEPTLPVLAAARAGGAVSARQVDVIARCLGTLRAGSLSTQELAEAEDFLLEQAELFDAGALVGIARLTADLDSETAALAMTVLHSLAAPKPATDGDPDERTAGQRMHDAFRTVLKIALRSTELPRTAGGPATVLITMTAEQFETRTGLATTSYGQQLSIDQALRTADQTSIAWIVHNSTGGILNYGTARRFATEKQSLVLIARDRGCAFPGCTDPPEWTEKHHVILWAEGGPTDLDNLCLLCDYHHHRIDTGGWRVVMRNRLPEFIPPIWIDPDQRPRRNQRIRGAP